MTSARVIDPEFLVALPASSSVISLSEDTSRAPHIPRPRLLWSASMVRSCNICPKTCCRQFFQQCLSAHDGICNLQHRPLQAGAVLSANYLPPIKQDSPLSRGNSLFAIELLCIYARQRNSGPDYVKVAQAARNRAGVWQEKAIRHSRENSNPGMVGRNPHLKSTNIYRKRILTLYIPYQCLTSRWKPGLPWFRDG